MKKYVVSLLAFLSLLAFQTPQVLAGGFVSGGFASRGFVVGAGPRHFVSPSVIIRNPGRARFVHVSPFARKVIIFPHHHSIGNSVIIREPFFCFRHGIGFINEPLFFDHLHRFHGVAFGAIPRVIVHSGSQVFFFGN